ncbi:LysM peptidoglycan-binding domain-containing protein [Liquorilactobacillus uvarum]|uniref:Lys n=1 Tax=Liquorilactobacillus uvarum DSM 19971 TaxID=1423812 RepID=A0A0R1PVL1_9LACO|nr:LysM peptidoglycan-binding domain-containing protein [Liquorilactobacillus uvarum]KRL36633.1 lys [Liquorilactobacillus uvarum DSM 19971]
MKIKKILIGVAAMSAAFLFAVNVANADTKEQGVDLSGDYQGQTAVFGQASDRFAIVQIGGYYDGSFHPQKYYQSQVASTIAQGKRAHTYIYSQFSTREQADQMLDYYLPKVQTPKGSIVALDVESGNPNTDAVRYALNKVKSAGYTAVLYGYKSFLVNHLDLSSLADNYPLWLGEYPDYSVTISPNYNYFPSYKNIHLFQFTSTYKAGGLDGNVDLLSITKNGYSGTTTNAVGATTVKTDSTTMAIKQGQTANNTNKHTTDLTGYTVKVNFTAKNWYVGGTIPSWVKGKSYTVQDGSSHSDRVLLGGILSWIKRSDIEVLQTKSQARSTSVSNTYTVRSGDSWWSIANTHGISMYTLATLNGKSINSVIYPGQTLKLLGSVNVATRYYKVQSGDSLSYIANKLGVTTSYLKSKNNIQNVNLIYAGQSLAY